jgi:hypothetical protein
MLDLGFRIFLSEYVEIQRNTWENVRIFQSLYIIDFSRSSLPAKVYMECQ